jgi:hypothetical protein
VIEHLLCKCKALSSNPCPIKKKGGGVRQRDYDKEKQRWMSTGKAMEAVVLKPSPSGVHPGLKFEVVSSQPECCAYLLSSEVILHQGAHHLLGRPGGAQVGCDGAAQHPLSISDPTWREGGHRLTPTMPSCLPGHLSS